MGLNIPIPSDEVLEEVFKKLSVTDLKTCRFVCKEWNNEIVSHGRLNLVLNDLASGNLSFFMKVNNPRCVKILNLKKSKYSKLKAHSLAKITTLSFGICAEPPPFSTLRLTTPVNLKFFNDYCTSLTKLSIYTPVLGNCDLEFEAQNCTSLFPNLNMLFLAQVDQYNQTRLPQQIRNISKNICFLLQVIRTQKLKSFLLQVNELFYNINCCAARGPYRFEDFILPQFICSQQQLESLQLSFPPSLPNKYWTPSNKYPLPTTLKSILIESRVGEYVVAGDGEEFLPNSELLQWNIDYYDQLDEPMQAYFWKSLCLGQRKLESFYFSSQSYLADVTFPTTLVANNLSTLRVLMLKSKLVGTIDASLFGKSILEELDLRNYLIPLEEPDTENQCWLINIKCLPPTLKKLQLVHISFSYQELEDLANGTQSLETLQLHCDQGDCISFDEIDGFDHILKKLLRRRNFDLLVLGQIGDHSDPKVDEILLHLTPFCDYNKYLRLD